MERERRLRRVGGSVMVPLPPDLLADAGLAVGQTVRLRSRPGAIAVEAVEVSSSGVVTFAARFVDRYREDLGRLDAG
ncbi:MAG: AbrB/MazE/SpoVT family DNA-binding domain-containing protein [Candidatus Dormibacteria bacterium]